MARSVECFEIDQKRCALESGIGCREVSANASPAWIGGVDGKWMPNHCKGEPHHISGLRTISLNTSSVHRLPDKTLQFETIKLEFRLQSVKIPDNRPPFVFP